MSGSIICVIILIFIYCISLIGSVNTYKGITSVNSVLVILPSRQDNFLDRPSFVSSVESHHGKLLIYLDDVTKHLFFIL